MYRAIKMPFKVDELNMVMVLMTKITSYQMLIDIDELAFDDSSANSRTAMYY